MLLTRLGTRRPLGLRFQSTRAAIAEYTEEARYPEILDLSFEARQYRKKKEAIAKRIQALPTVEEKVMALNMKKYFGYKCIMMNDKTVLYNSLPMIQYATRTKFNDTDQDLPEYYAKLSEPAAQSLPDIKGKVEEAIFFELECYKQAHDMTEEELNSKQKARILSSAIVNQVHRVITDALADQFEHLRQIDTDVDPVHEAFWLVGGIEPLEIVQKIREGQEWQKKHKMDPVDRPFQYIGKLCNASCYRLTFHVICIFQEIPIWRFDTKLRCLPSLQCCEWHRRRYLPLNWIPDHWATAQRTVTGRLRPEFGLAIRLSSVCSPISSVLHLSIAMPSGPRPMLKRHCTAAVSSASTDGCWDRRITRDSRQ